MISPQQRLRTWLSRRIHEVGVTKTQVAKAINRDESAVRRMLCEHSDIRIDLERHLLPLMNLLQLTPVALAQAFADAHELHVQVIPRADPEPSDFEGEEPTLVNLGRLMEAQAELIKMVASSRGNGGVSRTAADEAHRVGAKAARSARAVAACVLRRAK